MNIYRLETLYNYTHSKYIVCTIYGVFPIRDLWVDYMWLETPNQPRLFTVLDWKVLWRCSLSTNNSSEQLCPAALLRVPLGCRVLVQGPQALQRPPAAPRRGCRGHGGHRRGEHRNAEPGQPRSAPGSRGGRAAVPGGGGPGPAPPPLRRRLSLNR